MASNMGHARVSELAESMRLEWSDAALADIDGFVELAVRLEHMPRRPGLEPGPIRRGLSILSGRS